MEQENQDVKKENIMWSALDLVKFDGWHENTLIEASEKAGYPAVLGELIFINSNLGAIDFICQYYDKHMLEAYKKLDVSALGVRDRIAAIIIERIKLYNERKLSVVNTMSYLTIPAHIGDAHSFLWRSVDLIWYEAGGDKSTDHNYYTKRGLLEAVYSATMLFWISDDSDGSQETIEFLKRRLDNVVFLGKKLNVLINKVKDVL